MSTANAMTFPLLKPLDPPSSYNGISTEETTLQKWKK